MDQPVYALNLFNVASKQEYLAYAKRSVTEVESHGGRVVLLGQYRETVVGDLEAREVMIIVEWSSRQAFEHYCSDPGLADLHPHRVNGTSDYIWQLFDKLEDLRPVLK